MAKCKHEMQNGICEIHSSYSYCRLCDSENLCKAYEPKTNADRIRAMSDDLLASQLVVVVEETIKALTGLDVPDEALNEVRSKLLERLKQPAERE